MRLSRAMWMTVPILLLIAGLSVYAQSPTGAVNGTVWDETAAVVPGTTVRLTNQNTGIEKTTTTNASGFYVFSDVLPGTYALRAEMKGFRTWVTQPFTVSVNQTITQNIELVVGEVTESVQVTAETPLLQASTSELGVAIEHEAIRRLPLNGRNFTQLLLLTPGVTPVNTAQEWGATATLPGSVWVKPSVNGQWNRSNLYLMDGVINMENLTSGYSVLPSLDAIEEFKVQSHNDKGEYGLVMGGVVNLVTRTGTNALHGSLFEFLRNEVFNARNPFTDFLPGKGPAAFRQNQFGASVGGPVYLPRLYDGRNKTFFFFSYDGWRYRLAKSSRYRVPVEAEYAGDFSGWAERIYDPATTSEHPTDPDLLIRLPFPNNKIPANRISPMGLNTMRKFYDTPNASLGYDNVINNRPGVNDHEGFQIRIDHQAGTNTTLFARWNDFRLDDIRPRTLKNGATADKKRQQLALGWNQIISPMVILNTRAAFTTAPWQESPEIPFALQEMLQLGWLTASRFGQVRLSVDGISPWPIGGDPFSRTFQDQIQLSQDIGWRRGNHQLKFGWLGLRQTWGGTNPMHTIAFGPDQTADPAQTGGVVSGIGLASALLGLPVEFEGLDERFGHRWYTWSFYGQDEWKVTPSLTLNLSLRYEFENPTKYFQPRPATFDYRTGDYLLGYEALPPACDKVGAAPCIPGDGNLLNVPGGEHIRLADRPNIRYPDRNNFSPRLGVAWQFAPKTVLRAGAGIVYDVFSGLNQQSNNIQGRWPDNVALFRELNLLGEPLTPIETFVKGRNEPLPDDFPWYDTAVDFDPQKRTPYSGQFHVEFQHQFTDNVVGSLGYVGSANRRTDLMYPINTSPTPGPGSASDVNKRRPFPYMPFAPSYGTDLGRSSHNALLVTLNRRFGGGTMLLVSYSWSKTIDNGASGWFGSENGPSGASAVQNPYDFGSNRSVSAYDVAHNFWISGTWELPFGRGRTWLQEGAAAWALGNWRLDFIQSVRSGQPYNTRVRGDLANIGRGGTYMRPNLIGDPNPQQRTADQWLDPAAFGVPRFAFGNLGRNVFRMESVYTTDLALAKEFTFTERIRLEFRAESYNLFNIMNYGVPGLDVGRANFGSITSLTGNQYPRQFQFGLRLSF